jgi:methionyl-tRNA synthetase
MAYGDECKACGSHFDDYGDCMCEASVQRRRAESRRCKAAAEYSERAERAIMAEQRAYREWLTGQPAVDPERIAREREDWIMEQVESALRIARGEVNNG